MTDYNPSGLTFAELCDLIQLLKKSEKDRGQLYLQAASYRNRAFGSNCLLRGLIEISSYCKRQCLYCGLRASNSKAQRYRLGSEDILECCNHGYEMGLRTFVLQGGEDPWFSDDRFTRVVSAIKRNFRDVAVTLSVGERPAESYRALKQAGADRFLLRHECADPVIYKKLHPDSEFTSRKKALFALRDAGFQTGAGFMTGLPGESVETMAKNLLFLKELKPHMAGIGPFIPHPQTPLSEEAEGNTRDTIMLVALTRLLLPEVLLPATTALGVISKDAQIKALKAGANVLMPNLTPKEARPKYLLYENNKRRNSDYSQIFSDLCKMVKAAGLQVDFGRGDHLEFLKKPFSKLLV